MSTKELSQAYDSLPEEVKSAMLALSILIDRIGSLPKPDRDDLFELLQAWREAEDPVEQRSIREAMDEILAQIPASAKPLLFAPKKPLSGKRMGWAAYVGRKIKELREQAGLTQMQLAAKAGLPQSHLSRLENAEHSATNLTLEKIATALGVAIGQIDPCAD